MSDSGHDCSKLNGGLTAGRRQQINTPSVEGAASIRHARLFGRSCGGRLCLGKGQVDSALLCLNHGCNSLIDSLESFTAEPSLNCATRMRASLLVELKVEVNVAASATR